MTHLLFMVLILTTANISFGVELKELYEWKYIDYVWENSTHKQNATEGGHYNPSANVVIDADQARDGRIFVTVVRDKGVPASLMTISDKVGPGGPLLSPYPGWTWYKDNTSCGCNTIISVYRVSIKCNHLFVLDTGAVGEEMVCPPKLLIFNLENDKLVKCIVIPRNVASNKNGTGLLVTPLAYVRDCNHINNAVVYIADTQGYGLVIYNKMSGFCRVESDFMEAPDPVFTIQNQSFYLDDGILGLTMIGTHLYHASLAGHKIFKIDMSNLQECSELNRKEINSLTKLVGTLSGQTAAIASAQHAIFFSNIPETSILCANTKKEFNAEIIVQDSEKLQFASGMKVTSRGRKLLIVTDRHERVRTNTLDLNETNSRILTMNIAQIRKETNCFSSHNHNDQGPVLIPKPWWLQWLSWLDPWSYSIPFLIVREK